MLTGAALATGSDAPGLQLKEILVGGRAVAVGPAQETGENRPALFPPLEVARGDFPLELEVGSAPATPAVRITTLLEGHETEWQDHESGMWLVLRFLDEANRATSSASFPRRGTSSGWRGLPQGSRFQQTVETAVVPAGARKVQLLLVSGGTPRTTGFWAVRRLHLATAEGATGPFVPRYALERLEGTNLESERGIPRGWTRDGTELTTPHIHVQRDGDAAEPMLALADMQPLNTGGWLMVARDAIPVEPGQHLRFECEELYSIGRGGDARVILRTLPVGDFLFRARAGDEFGRPVGPEIQVPIRILPPFYATKGFQIAALVAVLAALAAAVRYVTWRKVQRELRRLEAQRAIEEERTRIARDLHDEMGARLTQISLLAGRLAPADGKDGGPRDAARQLKAVSRDLATALDEIVWAADPRHDTLESLGNYLSQYAGTIIRDAGLRCRLDIAPLLPDRALSSGTRHRLMMAAKEAFTNALKHARATEIRVRLAVSDRQIEVSVEDDGAGFDPAAVRTGHGLENLRRRLEEMGGTCDLRTAPGRGTTVTLRLPHATAETEAAP